MDWFYRLQQRCALTRRERTALLTLSAFLLLGLALRHLIEPAMPVPPDPMEDRLFAAGSAAIARPDSALAEGGSTATLPPAPPGGAIDPNTATSAQLQGLPGVGPALAARIIAYRQAHGPFRRVQDLTRVRGIGEKTLARLAPYLHVEAP